MFGKRSIISVFMLLVVLLLLPLVTAIQAEPQAPEGTEIVVDTGTDPDNNKSRTCITHTPCSLRRAIVQAGKAPAGDRPITIKFNIPKDVAEGYRSDLKVWELEIKPTSDPSVFRRLEFGQITIDGSTQPGGRGIGPKIILVGPGSGQKDGIIVGVNAAGTHDKNVIRGLGFQNFKTHLYVNSNKNLIEENWFGLTSNGKTAFLRKDDREEGSGNAGIALSAGVADNQIVNNVFLGLDGVAAAFRGENNSFRENLVGTNAAGETPGKKTNPALICTKVDWLGGGGISLEGDGHTVSDNIFSGLYQQTFRTSTQPEAISLTGEDHLIEKNWIGKIKNNGTPGVCGRGVYLHGSPENVVVKENTIINSGMSAISLNGKLSDANTFRSNVIKNRFQWKSDDEYNPEPEDAIQLGPSIPDEFKDFNPARVTQIDGTSVKGTNGIGSPCPKCVVEVFLDDDDRIKEAYQSLAVVQANNNGYWTATLPFKLNNNQRLRTTSTTTKYNTIPYTSAGTTTGLSDLYSASKPCQGKSPSSYGVCLPAVIGTKK